MDTSEPNLDKLYYDYAHPIREVERLHGRQDQIEEIQQFVCRPQGGLGLIIGGARSGRTSLLRTMDRKYQASLEQLRQAQLQGRPQPLAQAPVVLACYFSLADELAGLEVDEQEMNLASGTGEAVHFNQARLHAMMLDSFNLDELRGLCFEMGIDYELLLPQGKAGLIRELILHFKRRHRVRELVDKCQALRGDLTWNIVYEEAIGSALPAYGPDLEVWRAGRLCEQLVRGLRERARDALDVCRIESRDLDFPPSSTPASYFTDTLQKVRAACHNKVPVSRLKLVLLADDADALLDRTWRFTFLAAVQGAFSKADLVLILAGGSLLSAASQDRTWRNFSPYNIPLNALGLVAARDLAEEPLEGGHLPEAFVSGVYKQTSGHPYLLKFFLNNVKPRAALIADPSPDRLAQSAQNLLRQESELQALFGAWSDACGEMGRFVYRLLLNAGGTLSRTEIVQQTAQQIQPGQLDSILEKLCYHSIVDRLVDGIESYSVRGEMFSDWFRKNIVPTQQIPQVTVTPPISIFATAAAQPLVT